MKMAVGDDFRKRVDVRIGREAKIGDENGRW